MEVRDWNWGAITPEAYNDATKEALHVLNVHFIGQASRDRVIRFTCARLVHFHQHLPVGSTQRIRFDLRGQLISNKNLESARETIVAAASKHGIRVSVEFLTN